MNIIKRHHFLLSLFYCVLFIWLITLYQGSPAFQQGVDTAILHTQQQVSRLLGERPTSKQQTASRAEEDNALTDGR